MKKLILFFVFAFAAMAVKAQEGYNYKEFGIGLDVSYERGYTNVQRQDNHIAENISFTYNYSPYVPVTAELQFGTLSGGGTTVNLDKYGRQYTNKYEAFIVHADLQLGEMIDYSESGFLNIVKNIYFGSGGGLVFNNNTVQRINLYPQNGSLSYRFPGQDNSINIMIPFRFGYEFKIYNDFQEPYMAIDLGYVHSVVFGSGLDGYDDNRAIFKHNSQDQYRQIVIGVKFNFGNVTSFNKLIRRF